MGWRERDYARFTDDERRALLGSGDRGYVPPAGRPLVHPRRRGAGAVVLLIAAALAIAAGATRYDVVDRLGSIRIPSAPSPVHGRLSPRLVDSSVVRVHWRRADLSPAAGSGRICLRDPRHGVLCAGYVSGERPADVLTRRIRSLGLNVESG